MTGVVAKPIAGICDQFNLQGVQVQRHNLPIYQSSDEPAASSVRETIHLPSGHQPYLLSRKTKLSGAESGMCSALTRRWLLFSTGKGGRSIEAGAKVGPVVKRNASKIATIAATALHMVV